MAITFAELRTRTLKRVLNSGKAKQWLAFLNNHCEVIAAFDFFTVPSAAFHTLYCFFVIEHGRRRILHFNVTRHPTSEWIVQQLRESFPLPSQYRYVLFDHDAKFGGDVLRFLKSSDLIPMQTSIRSPWQNGIAERFVGSIRREVLDHVIPLNEFHLRRLGREYLAYYHEDRTHIGLDKNTPSIRAAEPPRAIDGWRRVTSPNKSASSNACSDLPADRYGQATTCFTSGAPICNRTESTTL